MRCSDSHRCRSMKKPCEKTHTAGLACGSVGRYRLVILDESSVDLWTDPWLLFGHIEHAIVNDPGGGPGLAVVFVHDIEEEGLESFGSVTVREV